MKRAITGVATLVGLVLVICSVMGFVLLGSHGTWHSELQVPAGRSAIVIEPALASVIGPTVSVQARTSSPGAPIFIGRARPDDTAALVDTTNRLVVTGLDGARRLTTRSASGSEGLPPLDQVDVWHSRVQGDGAATLVYRAAPGAESAVIARADGAPMPAVSVRLAWSDRTWFWVPVLMLVLGLGLLYLVRRWNRPPAVRAAGLSSVRRRARSMRPHRGGAADRPSRSGHVGRRRAASRARRG
ncbi:hypothetical protein [Angustibacter sp. Root456]|uniref:hypothetical protein n=1 Tax=Angustibacter sp. Root456 TaxID=1736539 RepID=UPI0007016B66|nr:hypothetical protein [Angustibacter sp. Root456]KQX69651.1 hypothetical protein ASD06_00925 [Angustibacter sp. Root456]